MDVLIFLREEDIVVVDRYQLDSDSMEQYFAWDNLSDLTNYLVSKTQDSIFGVVLDFIDETITNQWYAKLLPWEQGALEKRQVQKFYADGAAFVNFVWNPHYRTNDQGRSEQEVRIATVSQTEFLIDFFKIFADNNLALKAIYSNTFLIDGLFLSNLRKPLHITSKQSKQPVLLIAREAQNSFRQVLLNEGQVQLTRLIEIDEALETEEAIAYALIDETKLVIKYIYNQKTLPYNSAIGMVYLDDRGDTRELILDLYQEKICLTSWDLNTIVVGGVNYQMITNKKILPNEASSFRHAIASYVFHRNPPSFYENQLTNRVNKLISLRQGISVLALLAFVIGVYFNGQVWVENRVLKDSNDSLALKSIAYQHEIEQIQKAIKIDYDAEDIKQVVDFSNEVVKAKIQDGLGLDLQQLSHVFNGHPEIQLTKLAWKPLGKIDESHIKVTIYGDVGPFQGAFKPSLSHLDSFLADIKALPGVKNLVLELTPLERDLNKALLLNNADSLSKMPFVISYEVGSDVSP